jgi:tetratricopeptide (TPR) repeat protein
MAQEGRSKDLNEMLDSLDHATDSGKIVQITEAVLVQLNRDENPKLWAILQGGLGASLMALTDPFTHERMERILDAYRASLSVLTPEEDLPIWRQTQRNLGATYLAAVEKRIGHPQEMIESAITAYEETVRPACGDEDAMIWLQSHRELASAYQAATQWRGPIAYVQSADALLACLSLVTRQGSAEQWAALKLMRAELLSESGLEAYVEEAIQEAKAALEVLTPDTQPQAWASAHLTLGGLYRTRPSGVREENLERATRSLDLALSIFTCETTPQEWYRAHYHRGPAYAFLVRGDRGENLERARESLQIAIDATPKEHAMEAWASLQVTLGQVYLERIEGQRQENLEAAIEVLESTLQQLPARPPSLAWLLANRFLGQAYLAREAGSLEANTLRAIEVLKAARESTPSPDDSAAWCTTNANLGIVYCRNVDGDRRQNRLRAIGCYEAALSVPPEHWPDTHAWSDIQARRLLLYTDETGETLGRRAPGSQAGDAEPAAGDFPNFSHADVFDLKGQAETQSQALHKYLEGNVGPHEMDPDWHVPWLLNEQVSQLMQHFREFRNTGRVWQRSRDERAKLEQSRKRLFHLALEHLAEKHTAAYRTQSLFREVEKSGQGFILFLRGFAYRPQYYDKLSVVHGSDVQETIEKERYAQTLAPVPLVWISNPVDSGPLEAVMAEREYGQPLSYRVEAGLGWEKDVQALIDCASYIIMYNPQVTPGVRTELGFIERLGRLQDAYFHSPEKAAEALGLARDALNPLSDEALERMRQPTARKSSRPLPEPSCLWVQGKRRERLEHEIRGVAAWLEHLSKYRTPATVDLELDAYAYLTGMTILLEDTDRLAEALNATARTLGSFEEAMLEEAGLLADGYTRIAALIENASRKVSADLTLITRTMQVMHLLSSK